MVTQLQETGPAPRLDRAWPALALSAWRETDLTLHLCTQIVGKIRLALAPKMNQWWNVPLYLTTRGLTTSPMPYGSRTLAIDFDFIDHEVVLEDSDGRVRSMPLVARSVADFHRELFTVLEAIDVHVPIRPSPVEIPARTPLDEDTEHAAYDATYAHRFWRVLRAVEPVFERFRARFRGKCSPVHFFWGSFDLAVTRFNGRRAPPRSGSIIERDAYDEECISVGFWPGDAWRGIPGEPAVDAAFYAYAVPEPEGFANEAVRPAAARYDPRLKEFILPYEAVRAAPDPAQSILEFAQTTYEAAARLAGWNIAALSYP
jgi:hypothetical protein